MLRICLQCVAEKRPHHETVYGCYKGIQSIDCVDCPTYITCQDRFFKKKKLSHGYCYPCFVGAMHRAQNRALREMQQ